MVTAADILHDESVEVINPDHILCTLTDDVPFVLEMTVENGRGYRPAAEGHTDDLEVGAIPIDAIFSPVIRVEYRVDNTRVGQRTNYDKLLLRIWTTGTLGPEMALVDGKWVNMRVPYPLGFYAKWMDGRIDDPNAGWKGRGLWTTNGNRTPFHMETGKGTLPKVVKFQVRPDPLAH